MAQLAQLYIDLDLGELDLFKIVRDGHLEDKEDEPDKEEVNSPKEEKTVMLETSRVNNKREGMFVMKVNPPHPTLIFFFY